MTTARSTPSQVVQLAAKRAPNAWEETLRRYGVPGAAGFRALAAHWAARVSASAELRAELDATVAEVARWLRGGG